MSEREHTSQPAPPAGLLAVEPLGLLPEDDALYAELKNISTGRNLHRTLGPHYDATLRRLHRAEDTLESHTRAYLARAGGDAVGLISCIPFREYRARKRASRSLVQRTSFTAGVRCRIDALRRFLTGTELGPWDSGQLYIESLAVRESARRQGVATELLAFAAHLGRTSGHTGLSLNTMTSNRAAIALYEANGFEVHAQTGRHVRLIKFVEGA